MTGPQRDKAWRQTWHTTAPRAEFSRPADAVFEKAEAALLDPDRDQRDKRCAALAGVPQQVSPELLLPMWIPARELTATFSDTEIMTSLGSTPQSVTWTSNLGNLRDFKTVRNAGISFQCTDRDLCTKLGGESVTICGRKFKVQPYSKYSHWYYVDLQRLPDDATDGVIYDWFASQGTPPVFITPAHTIGGLRSRSRRVFFNQKLPPASVMLSKRVPLRQIQFTGQGYTVVHHRNRAFNSFVPPFIKELRAKGRQASQPNPARLNPDQDDTGAYRPHSTTKAAPAKTTRWSTSPFLSESEPHSGDQSDNGSDASDGDAMVDISSSEGEPHSGDQSDDESSHRGSMDGFEGAIVANPKSIWPYDSTAVFPVGATQATDRTPDRIKREKCMVFGTIADPAVDLRRFPPSQTEYPMLASVNSYEWLSDGLDGPIPPDQNLILWDNSTNPPQSVASYVELSETTEGAMNAAVRQGNVEQMSLQDLCATIEDFLGSFCSQTDPDLVIASVQDSPVFIASY